MANTIMTAKNTFAEALVMDFAPDNTLANTLTSALNATLLTFNGNEMSLQNDMGNGRVETAYLPEGYIPVGTCEFGDIIYVVSYNPIINKSLIGCFPSPERNISSEEIGGMRLSLRWTDFQLSDGGGPSGELVSSSVKKVLYGSKDMTSGDKYIIYSGDIDSSGNNKYLSDYNNTSHQHGRFPKLVKIHVVSIEESGKITYLDSSTKWYKDSNFYIQNSKNIIDSPDLDSYRTMVNSAYSIFSSKVSGKLALLVELEKITGFSCTWSAHTKEIVDNSDYLMNEYSIYWNFNWTTDDVNINPSAVVLTKSEWTGEDSTHAGLYLIWELNTEEGGWMLGGANKLWLRGPEVPIAFPNANYVYSEISRVYSPESYSKSFDSFISTDSFEAKSLKILLDIKAELMIPDVELTKVNLAKDESGVPELGKYYFNCQSSAINDKTRKTEYYTSYKNNLLKLTALPASDDVINNTFNYPVVKSFSKFVIPAKLKVTELRGEKAITEWKNTNINNLIYYYELTPAMPYGLLREFSQDGFIDFKKIGTKSIKLNSWRYYNYENTSTLTWGLEAYAEPNKGISEVVFLFYDNLGLAAAYHNSGKISYNGKFTEYFTLNTSGTNYKLTNKDEKNLVFFHKGEVVSKDSVTISNTYLDSNGKIVSIDDMLDGLDYYLNDAGTLYSNCLYLVKIIIKYCSIGVLDEYIEDETSYIEDYRWYWTNTMFNNYYYSVYDFLDLLFTLNLDINHLYRLKDNFITDTVEYKLSSKSDLDFELLKANVEYINQNSEADSLGNISISMLAGLLLDYCTFNLKRESTKNILSETYLGKSYVSQSVELPGVIFSLSPTIVFEGIYPINEDTITSTSGYIKYQNQTGKQLRSLLGLSGGLENNELFSSESSYRDYKNSFSLEFAKKEPVLENLQVEYINDLENSAIEMETTMVHKTLNLVEISGNNTIDLTFTGVVFSKYYNKVKESTISCKALRPLICYDSDLEKYNMFLYNGHFYFSIIGGVSIGDDGTGDDRTRIRFFKTQSDNTGTILLHFSLLGEVEEGGNSSSFLSAKVLTSLGNNLIDTYGKIVPFFIMRSSNYGKMYKINTGSDNSNNPLVSPNYTYRQYFTYSVDYSGGFYHHFSNINDDNAYVVLAVLDAENKLHLTNCFVPINYNSNSIYLTVRYKSGAPYTKLRTVGDMVGAVLMNLYYTTDKIETVAYSKIVNFIKLESYSIFFTRDVISKLTVNPESDSNSLILLRGMNYDEYLEKLKFYIDTTISHNNVNVLINGIIKNCPIKILFNYRTKDLLDLVDPLYVILCSNGDVIFKNTGFSTGKLYYRNLGTDEFTSLGSGFRYYPLIDIKYENSLYIGTYDGLCVYSNSYIFNNFILSNELIVCSNTSEVVPEYYTFTINGYEDAWSGLWPINVKESLIINAKFG